MKNVNFIKGSLAIIEGRLAQTMQMGGASKTDLDLTKLLIQGDRDNISPIHKFENYNRVKRLNTLDMLTLRNAQYSNLVQTALNLDTVLRNSQIDAPIRFRMEFLFYPKSKIEIDCIYFVLDAPYNTFAILVSLYHTPTKFGYSARIGYVGGPDLSHLHPNEYTIFVVNKLEKDAGMALFYLSDIKELHQTFKKMYKMLNIVVKPIK